MTADPGDTLLVLRAQASDIEAFDGLFQRYARLLLKHLQYVLRDDSLTDDVLQDTLILIYRKLRN
jgi:DNA-directed RNA polymerase specialized sigma24 family protein